MSATVEFLAAEAIEAKASAVLKRLGLYGVPVNPVDVAEAEGIEVFHADFRDDGVSGILRREGPDFRIYVNSDHSWYRKRYTVAHELGHYFLHGNAVSTFVDPELNLYRSDDQDVRKSSPEGRREVQANMFAAALLMPAEFVRREFSSGRDVGELARMFGVSNPAMGYRIANLGLV